MATPEHALPHERLSMIEERSKRMACDIAAAALGYEEHYRVAGESVTVLTSAIVLAAMMSAQSSGGRLDADDLLELAQAGIQKGREKLAEKRARSAAGG